MELVRRVGLSPNIRKKQLSKGKVFGVPLDVLIEQSSNSRGIPDIVYQCAEYIRAHGLSEEGLFRIGGNRRLIDQLHLEYDNGNLIDLNTIQDIAVITSVFKSFFRELPQPLIPDLVSQEILKHSDNRKLTIAEFTTKLRFCSTLLPKNNFKLLSYLCGFLHEVGQHVKDTKMTDSSLAIVFGPNLFRIADDFQALQKQPAITRAMSTFITYHDQIFGEQRAPVSLGVPQSSVIAPKIPLNHIAATLQLPDKVIRVQSADPGSQPCFILPSSSNEKIRHSDKENITNNKVESTKKDWDDSWLTSLTQDSPSPETDDILARSHDSLSSMSPLTGSGNLSIQLSLHQSIKECVYDMLIPAPVTSEHSFNVSNRRKYDKPNTIYVESVPSNSQVDFMKRRKGPKPDYHANRSSTMLNNIMSNSDVVPHSPTPSPPPTIRRSSDGMFTLDDGGIKTLDCVTKDRASPPKRRQMSRPRSISGNRDTHPSHVEADTGLVPKLNLNKLSTTSKESITSIPSCITETSQSKASPSDSIASLGNKISLLKRQVHNFDRNFEKAHGRTPIGNDRRPINSIIKELNELKRLLYDAKSVQSNNEVAELSVLKVQFDSISEKMEEKRKQAGRPTDVSLMTKSQLTDEKLCIQKHLLFFEETYGRPKTKEQKDIMRPIYDRYRKVKIAINKPSSSSDLDKTPNNKNQSGNLVDTWNVTLGGSSATSGMELIKLPPEQLQEKLDELLETKKVLRKTLRDFEKSFLVSKGRKVLKDDRGPKENEYNEYKKVKAKIRLIETLIKRHDGSQTI